MTFNVKPFRHRSSSIPTTSCHASRPPPGSTSGPASRGSSRRGGPRRSCLPPATRVLACLVLTRGDNPTVGVHVWEDNDFAKRTSPSSTRVPDSWMLLRSSVNRFVTRVHRPVLELIRPPDAEKIAVSLLHRSGAPFVGVAAPLRSPAVGVASPVAPADARHDGWLDCGGGLRGRCGRADLLDRASVRGRGRSSLRARTGARIPLTVTPAGQLVFGMRIHVPRDAKPGTAYAFDLLQRDNGRVAGGFAVHVRVRRRT